MESLHFPVFVRAREERSKPPSEKKKSLLEMALEQAPSSQVFSSTRHQTNADLTPSLCGWEPPQHVAALPSDFVDDLRFAQSVTVTGPNPPPPLINSHDLRVHSRLLTELFSEGLRPLQQHSLPAMLLGRNCVLTGPRGCGKRCAVVAAASLIAQACRVDDEAEQRFPRAILVCSSKEESKSIHRVIRSFFKDVVIRNEFCAVEEGSPRCDIYLVTGFSVADAQDSFGSYGLSRVKFLGICSVDRFVTPPFKEKFAHQLWDKLLAEVDPNCSLVLSCNTRAEEVLAFANELVDGDTLLHLCQKDFTAWLNVIHDVMEVKDEQKIAFIVELIRSKSLALPLVIVTSGKQECLAVMTELAEHFGPTCTSDARSFCEGQSDLLVTTDYNLADIQIPSAVGVYVNYSVPRFNLKDSLTSRTRHIFSLKSREYVCQVLSLINKRNLSDAAAAVLKRFLIETQQAVPFFLRNVGSSQ